MNKNMKIIITLVIVLLTAIGSAIFFISSKINPEAIKSAAIDYVEKTFPELDASIGFIEYNLGASVTIEMNSILIKEKKSQYTFLEIGRLTVKVPLISILTSKGKADFTAYKSEIYLVGSQNTSNLSKILQGYSRKSEKSIPSFLKKSRINLHIKGLAVHSSRDNGQPTTNIQKILMKDINLKRSTAYEFSTEVQYVLSKDKELSTQLQLVGEIDLKKFLKTAKLTSTSAISFTNNKLTGLSADIPDAKGRLDYSFAGAFNADLSLSFEGGGSFKSKIMIQKEELTISELEANLNPKDLIELVYPDLTQGMSFNKGRLILNGKVNYDLVNKVLTSELEILLNKVLEFKTGSGIAISSNISGKVVGNELSLMMNGQALEGDISADLKTKIMPIVGNANSSTLNPVHLNVKLSDAVVPRSAIEEIFRKKSTPSAQEENFPKLLIDFEADGLKMNSLVGSFKATFEVNGDRILVHESELVHDSGSVNITLKKLGSSSSEAHGNISNMKLEYIEHFLPKAVSGTTGVLSGDIKGVIDYIDNTKSHFSATLISKKGELAGGSLATYLSSLTNLYPQSAEITNNYETMTLKLKQQDQQLEVLELNFIAPQNISNLKLKGIIELVENISSLEGSILLKSKKVSPTDKQEVFTIPVKLIGNPLPLLPDVDYTRVNTKNKGRI